MLIDHDADFDGVEMGIASADAPTETGLGRIIGVDWGHSGTSGLVLEMRTDTQHEAIPGPAVGQWRTIEIVGKPGTTVEQTTWGVVKGRYR